MYFIFLVPLKRQKAFRLRSFGNSSGQKTFWNHLDNKDTVLYNQTVKLSVDFSGRSSSFRHTVILGCVAFFVVFWKKEEQCKRHL